ncbi:antitoxin Xre/MbcA/ParS toxin-binding domain-containing protein [Thioalkalivibrio thiocyanoxidans]|uniref:antitoxin Xre/MbcA/ParS toxin-binding domain-containing protein n=1 Tax=Thioalkalivibrio thiocyanoxidans TaxID=152475 RepID=UPI0003828516|nr:antitoxin Xre/MbcA/ParS toxin-binding domain-containing protein [Thioalkalivibrio thiocyanoxidans]
MVMQAFDHWGLETDEALAMLGHVPGDVDALSHYRGGKPLPDEHDALDRAGHILGIHKNLRLLFPHERGRAYRWMKTHNRAFDGCAPVEVVRREGLQGLLCVRGYLERAAT